jgi:hypothetical protein
MSTFSWTGGMPGGNLQSYVYTLVDYSSGAGGTFNDWGSLNLGNGINTWQNHNW